MGLSRGKGEDREKALAARGARERATAASMRETGNGGVKIGKVIATVALAAVGLAACGGDGGSTESKTGKARKVGLVPAYCLYRSDSRAQMMACEARTRAVQVRADDSEAARWARGELQGCGESAGELCQFYREPARSK